MVFTVSRFFPLYFIGLFWYVSNKSTSNFAHYILEEGHVVTHNTTEIVSVAKKGTC